MAEIVDNFPHGVREVEHTWIDAGNGLRLAARLWLADTAEHEPVPAVLEYIPYRKRTGTRWRDEPIHRYLAGHGYAAVRVDVPGSGESEGLLEDEYSATELRAGEAVIAWLADQPWCSGRVGMIGKSWGGINALQLAARRPPALGAVVSVCASDDRFTTDAHYMGGRLLNENLKWGSVLMTLAALPPDPDLIGETWRDAWLNRIESLPLYPEIWMRHPSRDDYWRRDSVLDDYSRIACPVFAVGGWADAYTDAIFRLLEGLDVPLRALIGPWAHVYPHDGVPAPAIGFLQETLRFFDRWLRDANNAEDEPALIAFVQEGLRQALDEDGAPTLEAIGRFVSEPAWPSDGISSQRLRFVEDRLVRPDDAAEAVSSESISFRSPESLGAAGGAWCPFGAPSDAPSDQRHDDEASLCFDSAPLTGRLELLGQAMAHLELASDRVGAMIVVRLCDVTPDGTSVRVSYGLVDLAHRDGSENPHPIVAGARFAVRVPLKAAGHAFLPDHRVRVALSTAYWPIAWPSPEAATLTLFPSACRLELPTRIADDEAAPRLPPAQSAAEPAMTELSPEVSTRATAPGRTRLESVVQSGADDEGHVALLRYDDLGIEIGHASEERYSIAADDPRSARARVEQRRIVRRGDWSARIETRCRLSATSQGFRLVASVSAFENEERIATRSWRRRIRSPR